MTASSFVERSAAFVERLPDARREPQWMFPVLGLIAGFVLVVAVHTACPPRPR